jgi:putative ABC transport system permease protein
MRRTIIFFFRALKQRKVTSIVTIGGFAISMAVIIVLASFIINERSYNKSYSNYSNLYRLKRGDNASIPERTIEEVVNIPGVENVCKYFSGSTLYIDGDTKRTGIFYAADDNFLSMFDAFFIYGSLEQADLENTTSIVLTESFSKKHFGNINPIGEAIDFARDEQRFVTGVIKDPPANSSFLYDGFVRIKAPFSKFVYGNDKESFNCINSFFLINSNSDIAAIKEQLSGLLSKLKPFKDEILDLQPFSEVYFDDQIQHDGLKNANVQMIQLLSWIALIIMIVSVINYINLSMAVSSDRIKEICIKKTNGAGRLGIFWQFISESILVCTISMLLALVIALALSSIFYNILGEELSLVNLIDNKQIVWFLFSLIFVVGIVIGLYPAYSASRFSPLALARKTINSKGAIFRNGLTVFQFVVSLALIISLLIINKQIDFVKHKYVGFDTEQLVRIDICRGGKKSSVLKNKLLSLLNIKDVTATGGAPLNIYSTSSGNWDGLPEGVRVDNISALNSDTSFLSTYGIELIKGRNFRASESDVCVINNRLYKELEWDDLTGKKVFKTKVVGVMEDFHFKGMYNPIGSLRLIKADKNFSHLTIRLSTTELSNTISNIRSAFNDVYPGYDFEYKFYDDMFETLYQKEEKVAAGVRIFAIIAIFISCLGLFGLAEFSTKKRTKEIGVRKVNGARIFEIIQMLNTGFVIWVLIAFMIATPLSYYAMGKWLESFAYKTELSWWVFAIAGLIGLGIALLTVSWQSWKAATRNPVEALRYE